MIFGRARNRTKLGDAGFSFGGGAAVSPVVAEAYRMDFAQQSYSGPTPVSDPFADGLLTFSRSSAAMAVDDAGNWQQFATGEPRLTEKGLFLEGEARTNVVPNNTFTGASVGSIPPSWSASGLSGLSVQITDLATVKGLTRARVRIFGTPTLTSTATIRLTAAGSVPATTGDAWVASFYLAAVSGVAPANFALRVQSQDAGGSNVATSTDLTAIPISLDARTIMVHTVQWFATHIGAIFIFTYTRGVAVDYTFDIMGLQLERASSASSIIPTTGAAATRAPDAVSVAGPALAILQGSTPGVLVGAIGDAAVMSATLLSVNGSAALSRRSDYGIETAFGASLTTPAGRKANWLRSQRAAIAWGGGTVKIGTSADGGSQSSASGTPSAVSSAALGGANFSGFVTDLVIAPTDSVIAETATITDDVVVYG